MGVGGARRPGWTRMPARPPASLPVSARTREGYAAGGLEGASSGVGHSRPGGEGVGGELAPRFQERKREQARRAGCRRWPGGVPHGGGVEEGECEGGEDQSTGDDFITTRHSSATLKYQKSGGLAQAWHKSTTRPARKFSAQCSASCRAKGTPG